MFEPACTLGDEPQEPGAALDAVEIVTWWNYGTTTPVHRIKPARGQTSTRCERLTVRWRTPGEGATVAEARIDWAFAGDMTEWCAINEAHVVCTHEARIGPEVLARALQETYGVLTIDPAPGEEVDRQLARMRREAAHFARHVPQGMEASMRLGAGWAPQVRWARANDTGHGT